MNLNQCRTIIDGYNLIFQCGLKGKSRSSAALERARDRLIGSVASQLSPSQRRQTAIVFDAKRLPVKETHAVSQQSGLVVIYAVDHEDADALIEELIQKHSSPKQLTIVSSDHRLHKAARRRKATAIDSDIWYDQIENLNNQIDGKQSLGPNDKHELIDELRNIDWSKEFELDDSRAKRDDPKIKNYDPFPPGYGEDIVDE